MLTSQLTQVAPSCPKITYRLYTSQMTQAAQVKSEECSLIEQNYLGDWGCCYVIHDNLGFYVAEIKKLFNTFQQVTYPKVTKNHRQISAVSDFIYYQIYKGSLECTKKESNINKLVIFFSHFKYVLHFKINIYNLIKRQEFYFKISSKI